MAGIINKVNNQNNENNQESTSALIPENPEEETTDEPQEPEEKNEEVQKPKMKGQTRLRAKKKPGNVVISGSNDSNIIENNNNNQPFRRRKIDRKNKKGYDKESGLRARFLDGKEVIDEDHLYVEKGKKNASNVRLRGRINKKIDRIKQAHKNKSKTEINSDTNDLDDDNNEGGFYNKFVKAIGEHSKQNKNSWISKFFNPDEQQLETNIVNVNFFQKGIKNRVQVLRSACKWSVGISKKENSILKAYSRLIDNAQHYIYIENQFVVSRSFNEEEDDESEDYLPDVVENMIAYHIRKRIERAYQSNEKFRVFVFIPLLPGCA